MRHQKNNLTATEHCHTLEEGDLKRVWTLAGGMADRYMPTHQHKNDHDFLKLSLEAKGHRVFCPFFLSVLFLMTSDCLPTSEPSSQPETLARL